MDDIVFDTEPGTNEKDILFAETANDLSQTVRSRLRRWIVSVLNRIRSLL